MDYTHTDEASASEVGVLAGQTPSGSNILPEDSDGAPRAPMAG